MNMSAQGRHRPSWTWLPSTRMRRQSWDSAPCATIRFGPEDLPRAGLAAEQHVAFGQVDVDVLAVFVHAQVHGVEHGERERGHRGQRPGVEWWSWRVPPFEAGGGGPPGACQGDRRSGLCGRVVLVARVEGRDEGQGGVVLVVRGQPRQRGGDGVAGRERVAADDVDGHQVGPAAVAGDPRVAGVAGGAELARCGPRSPRRRCLRGTAPRRVPRPGWAGSTR